MNPWRIMVWIAVLLPAASCAPFPVTVDRIDRKAREIRYLADPLSIPYETRIEQFHKGNLVINPSFERGPRPVKENPGRFGPVGWLRTDEHAIWVDTAASDFAADESASGSRAVRIRRKRAGEADEAEGIVSDFLPVIPGNYDFTYDVRLEDLRGHRARFGFKLDDALTVRVSFYDREKRPILSRPTHPLSGVRLDNSNKGYGLSQFWSIGSFPWGTVRGRTAHYPFSEGDVPEGVRYVRLFFGLKGTGTMWLDNIVFRYSKWNFTALERLKPYFGKTLSLEERLIPTPKVLHRGRDMTYFDAKDQKTGPPIVVLPENPAPAERLAARLLKKELTAIFCRLMPEAALDPGDIRILGADCKQELVLSSGLVFSIGKNRLCRAMGAAVSLDAVRDRPQGYVIRGQRLGDAHVVSLMGTDPMGHFYAAATAVQLLEKEAFVYHDARIADYPDFLGRSYCLKAWRNEKQLAEDLRGLERMSLYKFNKVYSAQPRGGKKETWYEPDDLYVSGIRDVGLWCRETGVMDLAVRINPYVHLGFEPSVDDLGQSLRYAWTHTDSEALDRLKHAFRIGLDAGAGTILLQADDTLPHRGKNRKKYVLYTEEDRNSFVNLQNAHAHVINHLKQWLDREYPGTRFEFCPPWYAIDFIDLSEGRGETYLEELTEQIPRDITIVWTGPTVRSLAIDAVDLFRIQSLIGRHPMLWDNTLYARNIEAERYGGYITHYPEKARMCNLFEPYDGYRPEGFHRFNDGAHMYVNGKAFSEIYRIKYATVADYEWNTAAYDPEKSLWKTLCYLYGMENAEKLILFSDAYYGLLGICRRNEMRGTGNLERVEADGFLERMNRFLEEISIALSGDRLVQELCVMADRLEERFSSLVEMNVQHRTSNVQ